MTAPPDAHAAEHEDLLHAHLAGDVAHDDPRLVARLAHCAACRERLDDLRSLTALLDRLGGEQRASLAPPAATAPGSDRVAATLQALAQGDTPTLLRPVPGPSRRTTLWRVGLAAASVVAAGWVVKTLLPEGPETREDVLLGDREHASVYPTGVVDRFDPVRWENPPPDAVYYRFRAWKQGEELEADPILDVRVPALPWTPEAADLETLNRARAIHWLLIANGPSGEEIGRCIGDSRLGGSD